jgi:hypothetical protein
MTTISKLCFVLLFAFGCATGQSARSTTGNVSQIGAVRVRGPSARAVVAGPLTIHAYSAFAGVAMYAAAVVAGTDSDCRIATPTAGNRWARLEADRIVTFSVGKGQVACVEASSPGNFELLWHVPREPVLGPLVIARSDGDGQ